MAAIVVWSAPPRVRVDKIGSDFRPRAEALIQTSADDCRRQSASTPARSSLISSWLGDDDHPGWNSIKASLAELAGPGPRPPRRCAPIWPPPPSRPHRRPLPPPKARAMKKNRAVRAAASGSAGGARSPRRARRAAATARAGSARCRLSRLPHHRRLNRSHRHAGAGRATASARTGWALLSRARNCQRHRPPPQPGSRRRGNAASRVGSYACAGALSRAAEEGGRAA